MTQKTNATLASMNYSHRGKHYDNNLPATAALVQRVEYGEWTVRLDTMEVGFMMKKKIKF